jgi:hypothetical protein
MGLLSTIKQGLKGLFDTGGGTNTATSPATTPPPAAGGSGPAPDAGKKPAKTGTAAVGDSLQADVESLERQRASAEAAQKEAMDNAYGIDRSVRDRDGGPTAAELGEQARELEKKKEDVEAKLKANEALKDKFKIVEPPKKASDPPNALTKEEYDKVLKQYSDIDRGKGDLQINTEGMSEEEAKKFKEGTMGDISKMLQTQEGREMLAKLGDNVATDASGNTIKDASGNEVHRKTTIGQYYEPEKDASGNTVLNPDGTPKIKLDASGNKMKKTDNAVAEPANYNEHGAARRHYYDASGNLWKDPSGNAPFLKGEGQDAHVGYSPGMSVPGSAAPSDVVLFHELRHAADMTRGNMDTREVGGTGPDAEFKQVEHQAVGLGEHTGLAATLPLTHKPGEATVPWNENQYRASRARIAQAEGPGGAHPDEANMAQRPSYSVMP